MGLSKTRIYAHCKIFLLGFILSKNFEILSQLITKGLVDLRKIWVKEIKTVYFNKSTSI